MPRKTKFRVIVDTNCWISFLIGRRLSKLVDLLSNERIQLVICNELLAEIREVTARPKFAKYFPKKDVESLIEFMQIIGETFEPAQTVIEAHAHYLVTGDQDLLVLQEIGTCRIIDAATFECTI